MQSFYNAVMMLGAVGSFIAAVFALIKAANAVASVKIKSEKLYGKEEEERYDAILKETPERYPNAFGPDEYKGGNRAVPQIEIERFYFDQQTMPPEWKKLKRTVRYYYEDKGKIMIRGWRFK
ncbi:MAG: hypothetical protein LBK63_11845 [Treponema sp.]|jgi:hypothetical protein|nr:hypothetical protein [Treponema sp.]